MKVGNVEVEQKLGTVRVSDLQVETSDRIYRGRDESPPVMRGARGLDRAKLIEVGVQRKINLKKIVSSNSGFKIDPEIQALFDDFDFFKVTLVADFSPKLGLKFVRGILRIKLCGKSDCQPVVYSIAPTKIEDPVKTTRKFGVSPNLKLFNIGLKPGIECVSEISCEEMHPQVIGHYTAKHWARWNYKTTRTIKEIVGTQIMELVVKQPVDKASKAQVEVEGELDWRDLKARFKGFLEGEFKPRPPSPNFETFTIP